MAPESLDESPKSTCVVVDTSVWRAEPLLKTPLGVTLVYTLSRRGSVIGLPEVVESELQEKIVEAGLDAAEKAKGATHMLRTLTDDLFFTSEFPTKEKLREKVVERIAQLGRVLVREPFTVEHARAALAMVNAKMPPSGEKNQQFKDCAIWQAVLSLSHRYAIVLLTNDKAFFCDRNPEKGLAENLVQDCATEGADVRAFYGIGPYLEDLRGDEPEFDREEAKKLIMPVAMQRLKAQAERHKQVPAEVLDFTVSAFPTETPDRLAFDYTITVRLGPVSPEYQIDREEYRGTVHGSAYFLPREGTLTDHYVQRVGIKSRSGGSYREFRDYDGAFAFSRPLGWD